MQIIKSWVKFKPVIQHETTLSPSEEKALQGASFLYLNCAEHSLTLCFRAEMARLGETDHLAGLLL